MEFCDLCNSAMDPSINKETGNTVIYKCKREICNYERQSERKVVSKKYYESTQENISIRPRLARNIINDITHMRTTEYDCPKCKKENTEAAMIRDMQDMSITLVCTQSKEDIPCSNVWKLED